MKKENKFTLEQVMNKRVRNNKGEFYTVVGGTEGCLFVKWDTGNTSCCAHIEDIEEMLEDSEIIIGVGEIEEITPREPIIGYGESSTISNNAEGYAAGTENKVSMMPKGKDPITLYYDTVESYNPQEFKPTGRLRYVSKNIKINKNTVKSLRTLQQEYINGLGESKWEEVPTVN